MFGREVEPGKAMLLQGDPLRGLRETGRLVRPARLFAPLPGTPPAIFGIGLNYREHTREFAAAPPRYPVVFLKNPASVNDPGSPVVIPRICADPPQVDYEAELAVVLARAARDVAESDALEYVLGYTAANDVTARVWQKQAGGGQWVRGKSFDTFCPLGPALVTRDQVPDPQDLWIRTRLNGRVVQEAHTSEMLFPVARLIAYLSQGTTLLPGTVILTGTPGGVGAGRIPPVFLSPGDLLEIEIQGIGRLVSPVAAEEPPSGP